MAGTWTHLRSAPAAPRQSFWTAAAAYARPRLPAPHVGACAYIAAFALPFSWDLSLVLLAVFSLVAIVTSRRAHRAARSPIAVCVLLFLTSTGVSLLVSEDAFRSARLSAPLLPASLLFLLITDYFQSAQHTMRLYATLSVVALVLACAVLWVAGHSPEEPPAWWVSRLGSPIFLVPNDAIFLALLTPISFAVLCRGPRIVMGVLAASSIAFSVAAMVILQSRVAVLTMAVSMTCAAALLRPRLAPVFSGALLVVVMLTDWIAGFPLAAKFTKLWDPRLSLWAAAWFMFLDAPLLGHGPHTFVLFYRAHLDSLQFPSWLPVESMTVPWVHNLYLEVLAEQGLIGLTVLALLLICGLSVAWRLQREASNEIRTLASGTFAGLIGFCVAAGLEITLLRLWAVIVLFTYLAVVAQLSSQTQRGRSTHVHDCP